MSVHLMTWNPTTKKTGRGGLDGNLSIATLLVVNRNNKKYLYLSKE